ncbi:MAG TPA: toxin-activating lysine-acyltransferase [Caulobacter sp.]|nr:toxin-activating lysine-acyltransferase [Caulobacter sp.]
MFAEVKLKTTDYYMVRGAQLGFATELLFETERRQFRIAAIQAQIWPAIRLGHIEFDFDLRGAPSAYLMWAFVSDEVLAELQSDPARLLHLSEWNEGHNLWLVDIVAPRGGARRLLSRLRVERFADHDVAHATRRDAGGAIRKVVNLNLRRVGETTGEALTPEFA